MLILIQKAFSMFLTVVVMFYGMIVGTNFNDTHTSYKKRLASVDIYENDASTAIPQTEVYNLITDHFTSALPEGKTEKKAIVLGYDGGRADALSLCEEGNSAILALVNEGGTASVAYCGGSNWPSFNMQSTSTAPGWCTMLTGQWANVHGIRENDVPKSNDCLTLLTTLVQDEVVDSSAFYVSWNGHFIGETSTYYNELQYIKENGINSTFLDAGDDAGTKANILADVTAADCSDFIFSIFEYCDHSGHDTGFCPENPDYSDAFASAEKDSLDIINAIKSRASYDTEDWLIIITSDHGGYNTGHGAFTLQERLMFIVTSKSVDYNYTKTETAIPGPIC